MSFIKKNPRWSAKFVKPGGYSPAELLEGLGAESRRSGSGYPRHVHLFTFNACDTTEAWRQEYLAALG